MVEIQLVEKKIALLKFNKIMTRANCIIDMVVGIIIKV